MAGENTAITVAGMTVAAGAAGGPLQEVFGELMAVYAIMGTGGGLTLGLFSKLPWREMLRGALLGGLLASGIGAATPHLVSWWWNMPKADVAGNVQLLAAFSFLVGFSQNVVADKLLNRKKGDADADS